MHTWLVFVRILLGAVMMRRCLPSDRSCGRGRSRGLREGSCCRPNWGHTLAARSCDGSSWRDQLERIRWWTCCPWQVTATGNRGYLHPTHNEKRSGHVTGPFIFKQVSPKEEETELWTQRSKTIFHLHWKPKLPLSSLHRVSHSESSLFENLSLKFVRFHMITIQEVTYTAMSFPPCSWTLSSLKNIVYPSHRERPSHQKSQNYCGKSWICRHLALSFFRTGWHRGSTWSRTLGVCRVQM